jgi:hypothetical protein
MDSDLTYVWLSNAIAARPEQLISIVPLIMELSGESLWIQAIVYAYTVVVTRPDTTNRPSGLASWLISV